MQFGFVSRLYRHPEDEISLRDVWGIDDVELNAEAQLAWKYLQDGGELAELHRRVAWLSQAIIEFTDLMDFNPSQRGRVQRKNYLYFEAVSAMREATVGMLNGSPRASTGLLRSVLEMFLLHCWWQVRMSQKNSTAKFYDWLEGNKNNPRFRDVVKGNFKCLGIPGGDDALNKVNDVYRRLCSYVHAPLLSESMTTLGQGNLRDVSAPVLRHWLELARDTLRIALEHLVHLKPQCLFPVDIPRKFAFRPPVGMYFDAFNVVPLKAVFGEHRIKEYRARLNDHEIVQMVMDVYNSWPDQTIEQIQECWDNQCAAEFDSEVPEDVASRWFLEKSRMRVLYMMLSYAKPLGPHW